LDAELHSLIQQRAHLPMRAKLGTKPLYKDPMPSSRTMWTTYCSSPFCVAPRSVMMRVPTTSAGDPTHVAAKPASRHTGWVFVPCVYVLPMLSWTLAFEATEVKEGPWVA